jgi:hypothetical protein
MFRNRHLRTVAFATVVQFVTLFGSGVTARAQTALCKISQVTALILVALFFGVSAHSQRASPIGTAGGEPCFFGRIVATQLSAGNSNT